MGGGIPSLAQHSGVREIGNLAGQTPGAILPSRRPAETPQHIKDAGKRAIDENKTFYTQAGWPNSYTSVRNRDHSFKLPQLNSGVTVPAHVPFGPTCSC
jgi:hypothetical protein